MDFKAMSDKAILVELATRLQRTRLNQNLSQAELARRAGISLRTLQYLEAGRETTLQTVIRVLRAVDRLAPLEVLLPEPGPSPIQLARLQGRERQRASRPRRQPQEKGT